MPSRISIWIVIPYFYDRAVPWHDLELKVQEDKVQIFLDHDSASLYSQSWCATDHHGAYTAIIERRISI